jgi:DNA-directed RNA polymerase specialized sigma24 family protein
MVVNACQACASLGYAATERQTLVRMLAAVHRELQNRAICGRARHSMGTPCSTLANKGKLHSDILAEFYLLAPSERASLLLSEVEDFTYEESAEVLGVSIDGARIAHVAVRLKLGLAFIDGLRLAVMGAET